jgi:hypothetical protein
VTLLSRHVRIGIRARRDAEQQRWFDDLTRNSCSAENAVKLMQAFAEIDVTASLAALLHTGYAPSRRHAAVFEAGRGFASMVPNAALCRWRRQPPYLDGEPVSGFHRNVEEFLGTSPSASAGDTPVAQSGLVTILFTDMEGPRPRLSASVTPRARRPADT